MHPKQPQILANQRLECVVAGLVKLACFGFDSHALPPRDPEPYGHWLDVYMEVNPLLQANVGPAELARSAGGRYETVGAKSLVIALNYAGLLEQRAIRNVVSFVQYRESAFEFEKSLEECLQFFVQDAHAQRASDRF